MRRMRKIYPYKRKTPLMYEIGTAVEARILEFTASGSYEQSVTIETTMYTTPVAIITATDNVNVWIKSLTMTTAGKLTLTVATSALFDGKVHVQVTEAST